MRTLAYGTNRTVKVLFRPHKIFCRNRLNLGLGKCRDPDIWVRQRAAPSRIALHFHCVLVGKGSTSFLVSLNFYVAGVALCTLTRRRGGVGGLELSDGQGKGGMPWKACCFVSLQMTGSSSSVEPGFSRSLVPTHLHLPLTLPSKMMGLAHLCHWQRGCPISHISCFCRWCTTSRNSSLCISHTVQMTSPFFPISPVRRLLSA